MAGSLLTAADPPPGLRLTYFVGMGLLVVLGARFSLAAALNRRAGARSQRTLWAYLTYAGAVATAYGLLGVAALVGSVPRVHDGVLLAFVLLLALTLREIHYNAALSVAERERTGSRAGLRWWLEVLFVAVVAGATLVSGLRGERAALVFVEAGAAVAFVGYGFGFALLYDRRSSTGGAMLDGVIRHLLPVLVFASLSLVVDVAALRAGTGSAVATLRSVLLVMTATAMLSATITIQQNVVGGRG